MPKYGIEVRTKLTRLWTIEASDMDEAERMAKEATIQLQYYDTILEGCEADSEVGQESDDPRIESSEWISDE